MYPKKKKKKKIFRVANKIIFVLSLQNKLEVIANTYVVFTYYEKDDAYASCTGYVPLE